ncbi:hypothetical protein CE143_20105 [Photorhabdus luminescens]|uniref:Uncharacterized protein n=1 Tax=Photorhabdus akhurstii TaxID=171438 RepID=A0ABX8LZC1_9GAMM|nr:hypothetical protein [Photorhabdus akhurstii]QXF35215.1 hypothetical protein B0X70_20060 [Photorhabdus akhurstii]UJD77048.1 hypothetical protein CE143_20105 [Photorhabdus luminescens]
MTEITKQEKLDSDARRLIEQSNYVLLRIISRICNIETENLSYKHNLTESVKLAQRQITLIENFLLDVDVGDF